MDYDRVGQALVTHLGPASLASPKGRGSVPSKGPIARTGIAALDEIKKFPVRLGQVVEVVGGSHSGKTQLLHLIAAHALANRTRNCGVKVCWFDLNGGLDPLRLRQLTHLATQHQQHGPEEFIAELSGLRVYQPDSTPALSAVLHKLPEFLRSPDGATVDTIIIDSLGSFHYLDRKEADSTKLNPGRGLTPLSNELILTRTIADILRSKRIVAYVSKCALFGEGKLTASWPFKEAGIPSIPADFMPSVWRSFVSHVLLIYQVEQNDEVNEASSRRAIVSLGQRQGVTGQNLTVLAASTVVIRKEGINASKDLHVV